MFGKIWKKERPRVYLGSLAVAPRDDLKRYFDQWYMYFQKEDLDAALRKSLEEIFDLPYARDAEDPRDSDLVIDVVIPKFQLGEAFLFDSPMFFFPFGWRPKVTVSARLYNLKSGKTIGTYSVTKKMPFKYYLPRFLTLRHFVRYRPLFDFQDMEYLLGQACHKLFSKMESAV